MTVLVLLWYYFQTKELDDRTERFDQDNEARLTEHQRLVEENEELTLRIEEEEKKVLFAEAERERIQEQLQETEEANAKLETEVKNSLAGKYVFKQNWNRILIVVILFLVILCRFWNKNVTLLVKWV